MRASSVGKYQALKLGSWRYAKGNYGVQALQLTNPPSQFLYSVPASTGSPSYPLLFNFTLTSFVASRSLVRSGILVFSGKGKSACFNRVFRIRRQGNRVVVIARTLFNLSWLAVQKKKRLLVLRERSFRTRYSVFVR